MTEEEKKIEEMEKEIAELKKKKAEMLSPPPEIPKEEEKEPEPEPPKEPEPELEEILVEEVSKKIGIPKTEFEGGIQIKWIDNRFHIEGVRGIPNGNRIIVRSLKAVDSLIRHLQYARDKFSQETMINTKDPK